MRFRMLQKALAIRGAMPRLNRAARHSLTGHRLQLTSRLVGNRSNRLGAMSNRLDGVGQRHHALAAFHAARATRNLLGAAFR
jgi:hypothetical protein